MADEDTKKDPETEKSSEPEATGEVEQSQEVTSTEASGAQQAGSEAPDKKEESEPSKPSDALATDEPAKKASKPISKDLEAISASLSNPTLSSIIEKIEKLSVLELADLVHALEDRFGVTAVAPVAVSASAGSAPAAGEPQEEQTTFNVILSSGGANKIAVIKAVRELVPTLGLKEAKDLVEAAPKPVMEGVNKDTANEAKTKLTAAGATVELQ